MRSNTDDRGLSSVLGYVLITGIVIVSASLVFVVGTNLLADTTEQSRTETGEVRIQEFDARLGSVASSEGGWTLVDLGEKASDEVNIRQDTRIEISVDGGACSATLRPTTVYYERPGGGEVAYEAGGVWRRSRDGASTMTSPPDVTFQNGTLSVSVVRLNGTIGEDRFRLRKLVNESRDRTETVREQLFSGDCRRPDDVTVRITSRFHDAWADYFEDELRGVADVTVDDAAGSVEFTLDEADLPEAVDESRNQIVDLSDPSIVDDSNPAPHELSANFTVNKSAGNRYFVSAAPVNNGTVVSDIQEFSGGRLFRPPIDVVIAMDESGSMGGDVSPSDSTDKIVAARAAAQNFVGLMNTSKDRLALVGYDTRVRTLLMGGQFFRSDPTVLNDTIDDYQANGGTAIPYGLNRSVAIQDVESNASRRRHVILLSDGLNNPPKQVCEDNGYFGPHDEGSDCAIYLFNEWMFDTARGAADRGIVVHSIAFGNGANETLLRRTANITGGTYSKATTGAELRQVFADIFANITTTKAIVNSPSSATVSIGGTRFSPQTATDADVAEFDGIPNINDPTVRGGFSFAVDTGDGVPMNVTAVQFNCTDYELTGIQQTNVSTGETYNRVRCGAVDGIERNITATETRVFVDGADLSFYEGRTEAWYQPDLYNDTLAPYLNDSGILELESNQALIVYDFPDPPDEPTDNRLVMLYEVGLPESTETELVVDVDVTNATVQD